MVEEQGRWLWVGCGSVVGIWGICGMGKVDEGLGVSWGCGVCSGFWVVFCYIWVFDL